MRTVESNFQTVLFDAKQITVKQQIERIFVLKAAMKLAKVYITIAHSTDIKVHSFIDYSPGNL